MKNLLQFKPLTEYLEARAAQRGEEHKIALQYARRLEAQHAALLAVAEAAQRLSASVNPDVHGEAAKLNAALAQLSTVRS
jgi:ABC-type transporter Mla subunit MlaD